MRIDTKNAFFPPIVIMVTKYVIMLPISVLLIGCVATEPVALDRPIENHRVIEDRDVQNHEHLAARYDAMANEMQMKADAKKERLTHGHYANRFGKNRDSKRFRAENKIRQYEQAAKDYRAKAMHHRAMFAEQTGRPLEKARGIAPEPAQSGQTGKF